MPLNRLKARRRRGERAAELKHDLDAETVAILERARPLTMTSDDRLLALVDAVRYVSRRGIEGAFAECGVWRGGSVLAMLLTLLGEGETDREIYLYDTFEGMTEPSELDTSPFERPAAETWKEATSERRRPWDQWFREELSGEDAVRSVLLGSGYPEERQHLVAGPVEETLPAAAPSELALLRLDTDWYESTRHELEHLYPRLRPGGILIIDDYGHWEGCRRAVEEYFEHKPPKPLLQRIDYTGRLAVKG